MANILNEVELNLSGTVYTLQTGGGSGVTSGEVQTMIDQSISGKADNDDLVTVSGDVIALSGIVINNEEVVARALNDLNDRKVESGDVLDIVSGYTYDKDTIDSKIASGGTFDPTLYYKKTETSSKTEIDDALLIDAYEDYRTKNTYTGAFPSLTGTADWNSAIQGGIYARHSTYWEDNSYEMSFKLQVVDENGNTFSAATSNITEIHFTVDNVNPLPEYIDVVSPTYEESPYYGRVLVSWIFKPKDGYRISYAEINSYWEDDFRNHNNINEVEWYEAFPSGYTKDIIEDYIEPKLANAQEKLTFSSNVKLMGSEGKSVPYVPTDYAISDWYSGSTNPVQTQAVYNYTYSKADIDAKIASGGGITSGDVLDIVSGYAYSKDEIDEKISEASTDILAVIPDIVSADTEDIKQDVAQLQLSAVTNAEYDSTAKTINFYNLTGGSVANIDATEFIKDGMIEDVQIVTVGGVSYLRITFNTESGHEDIDIDLSQIFDANNYYTKTEVNNIISNKIQCLSEAEWAQISGSTQSDVLYLIY